MITKPQNYSFVNNLLEFAYIIHYINNKLELNTFGIHTLIMISQLQCTNSPRIQNISDKINCYTLELSY